LEKIRGDGRERGPVKSLEESASSVGPEGKRGGRHADFIESGGIGGESRGGKDGVADAKAKS